MVGDFLKAYREEHELSRRQLAELLGLSETCIERLENGVVEPRMETLRVIKAGLHCSLYDLLDIRDSEGRPFVPDPGTRRRRRKKVGGGDYLETE